MRDWVALRDECALFLFRENEHTRCGNLQSQIPNLKTTLPNSIHPGINTGPGPQD